LCSCVLGVVTDWRSAIGFFALFLLLYRSLSLSFSNNPREGFHQWSDDLKNRFLKFQASFNPSFQFDLRIVQQQASPKEAEYLLKHNKWPWTKETETLYRKAVLTTSITSLDPGVATDIAKTIYNEAAVKELLSWNTKEGQFLLMGVTVGNGSNDGAIGLPANWNNTVRCNAAGQMQKNTVIGYDGVNGALVENKEPVKDADLPTVVPGFKFIAGECNPCGALSGDFSCPFSLNVGDGGDISTIWKKLWGIDAAKHGLPLYKQIEQLILASKNATVTNGVRDTRKRREDYKLESPYLNSNF
jgi:hypothetical protein